MFKLFAANLHLFDGAAGGGAAGDGSGAATGADGQGAPQGAPPTPKAESNPGRSRRGKSGDYANVVFGTPPDPNADPAAGGENQGEGNQPATLSPEERKAKFKEFMAEYKDLYSEEFNQTFNRRHADYKTLQEKLTKVQPIIDASLMRYGIDNGDIDQLSKAIAADDELLEDQAEEAGMTVAQYREYLTLKQENASMRQEQEMLNQRELARSQVAQWYSDAENVKAEYPYIAFDLEQVSRDDPSFLQKLQSGTTVEEAFKLKFHKEIVAHEAQDAATRSQENMLNNIQARGMRPLENGISSQGGFTYKADVTKLSRRDREEIARRAQRGEKQTLR